MVDSTAYIDRPWWAKYLQMVGYVIGYILLGVAGFAAVTQLGTPAHEAGYAIMAGCLLSAMGVITRLYHLELIGLWPLVTGLLLCVLWILGQGPILTGWLVAGLIPFPFVRLLVLNILANKARRDTESARALEREIEQ